MRVTITTTDRTEAQRMLHTLETSCLIDDVYNACRSQWKYGNDEAVVRFAERLGDMIREVVNVHSDDEWGDPPPSRWERLVCWLRRRAGRC